MWDTVIVVLNLNTVITENNSQRKTILVCQGVCITKYIIGYIYIAIKIMYFNNIHQKFQIPRIILILIIIIF